MNALLALLLKDRISAFTYVDRLAGMVRSVSREQAGGEAITIPVAIGVEDPLACGDSSVLDLVPDERYACMVYFEDKGLRAVKTRTRGTSFESRMRLVCWVNTAKLNGDAYAGDRILQQFIASFPSGLYNDGPFIGIRHTVEAVPERGKALFSAYTYPDAARQYLLYPFDAFAIELLTTLRVKPGCEEEVTAADAACWAPPANRRRRNPSEFSCDELNAPITGLSDEQKECIEGCGGGGETLCEQLADPRVNVVAAVDCIPNGNIPEWTVVMIGQAEATPEVIVVGIEGAGKADPVKAILCAPCPPCAPLEVLVNGVDYAEVADPCGNAIGVRVRDVVDNLVGSLDGSTWRIPSGTVTRDGSPFGTVLPGGTLDVPSDCPACDDATYQLKDSAGNDIGAPGTIASGASANITAPDGTVTINNSVPTLLHSVAVKSNGSAIQAIADSTITKPDGTTVGLPATVALDVRNYRSGIAYQFGESHWSGQSTSYRTGDEGDLYGTSWFSYAPPVYPTHYARLGANRTTLASNNIHGNTNRFTDRSGGQTYSDDIVQDHLTGIEWYRVLQTAATWNDAIDGAEALSVGGNTDWHLPPSRVLDIIANDAAGSGTGSLTFAPFNISSSNYWTGSTYGITTTSAWRMTSHAFSAAAKTSTNPWIACRRFI